MKQLFKSFVKYCPLLLNKSPVYMKTMGKNAVIVDVLHFQIELFSNSCSQWESEHIDITLTLRNT